tara:strand:+ start:2304 stop:3281 length:978 start_codon:yes stop_codon:yes gene_type:complete
MNSSEFRFAFRALARDGERREIVFSPAFTAHIEADPKAATPGECFLSHFQFSDEFRRHLKATGSTAGYTGPTWLEWLIFDIDVEGDIDEALRQAKLLVTWLVVRFKLNPDDVMIFYSGSKGFHVGLRSSLWGGQPAKEFHRYARQFAEVLAENAGVKIDSGVYARVNLLRAANSRHKKTGRYKVQLRYDELQTLTPDEIYAIAAEPRKGWIPEHTPFSQEAAECWAEVCRLADDDATATTERRASGSKSGKLNPTTRAVLTDGSFIGDRHRELFSAAANFGEFSSVEELAFAILTPAGLNSGLTASEVQRQISCGLRHGGRSNGE